MNDKIGNVSFYDSKQSEYSFTKPYSEATAKTIDDEVRGIIDQAYEHTKRLLTGKRNELEIIAQELLKKEIIFQTDLERLIGKRPFSHQTTYEAHMNGRNGSVKDPDQLARENEENVPAPAMPGLPPEPGNLPLKDL